MARHIAKVTTCLNIKSYIYRQPMKPLIHVHFKQTINVPWFPLSIWLPGIQYSTGFQHKPYYNCNKRIAFGRFSKDKSKLAMHAQPNNILPYAKSHPQFTGSYK